MSEPEVSIGKWATDMTAAVNDPAAGPPSELYMNLNVNEPQDLWALPVTVAIPGKMLISNGLREVVRIRYRGEELLIEPGGQIEIEPVDVLDEFGKAVEDVMRKEPVVPPAQRAYEAYCESAGGVSLVSGQRLPEWGKLKPEIQVAWAAAVAAACRSS